MAPDELTGAHPLLASRYVSSMPRVTRSPSRRPKDRGELGYATLSTKPLHVLAFLLPLMIAYEVGAIVYLTSTGSIEAIGAQRLVYKIFASLGGVQWHAPTFLLAAVLLVWHLLLKDPWKVRPSVLVGMALESFLWTLPVLVFGLLARAAITMEPAALADVVPNVRAHPWQARATLSIGAGLYEELLFRLILVTIFHIALVDLLKFKPRLGSVIAAIAAGVLFALYHPLPAEARSRVVMFSFYAIMGAYFGALFLIRGFGIVVAAHALYDVFALVVLKGAEE